MKIIGTSHIAKQSVKEIKKAFNDYDPDIVALELDRVRLHGLLTDQKPTMSPRLIKKVGVVGYLFAIIGAIVQKKLGNMVGTKPGIEMLTAYREAKKRDKGIYLLDQDISITLRKFSRIPLSEKLKFLWEIPKGMFEKQPINIDLKKVPDEKTIDFLIKQLKDKFPHTYKVLVSDRNRFMAKNLKKIINENPSQKVLVVVGAGHKKDLKKMVEAN